MRYRDGSHALNGGSPAARSAWRWFPLAVTAAMLTVVAVNFGMVYAAMHTFPGQAGSDGFDLSNRYDQVIERVQRQDALGWRVRAGTDDTRRVVLLLQNRSGAPLEGAELHATAERPLGPRQVTILAFHEAVPGRYVADVALGERGQWDVLLSAHAHTHSYTTTRRIVVR